MASGTIPLVAAFRPLQKRRWSRSVDFKSPFFASGADQIVGSVIVDKSGRMDQGELWSRLAELVEVTFFRVALTIWFLTFTWRAAKKAGRLLARLFCPISRSSATASVVANGAKRPPMLRGALVGMTGKAGHGKDSVGNFLRDGYAFQRLSFADPLKEAAAVLWRFKKEQLYGDEKNDVDPRWRLSPRVAMQKLGTEVGRDLFGQWMPHIGPNFWLEHMRLRLDELSRTSPGTSVVVCDVRFPNEADFIRKLGGTVIRVQRPGHSSHRAVGTAQINTTSPSPLAGSEQKTMETDSRVLAPAAQVATGGTAETLAEALAEAPAVKAAHLSETAMDAIVPDLTILNDGSLADLRQRVVSQVIPFLFNKRLNKGPDEGPDEGPDKTVPGKKRKRTPKCE